MDLHVHVDIRSIYSIRSRHARGSIKCLTATTFSGEFYFEALCAIVTVVAMTVEFGWCTLSNSWSDLHDKHSESTPTIYIWRVLEFSSVHLQGDVRCGREVQLPLYQRIAHPRASSVRPPPAGRIDV